jgi:2-C-methyl-D-erythritol 2,4-cyclodiphosphate synthase
LEATARVGAAVPGLPLSDTVKRVDGNGIVRATVPRSATLDGETLAGLTAVQTPQGARVDLLRAAYARFDFAHAEPTDEASLIEAMGLPVAVVAGDPINIKITRPEDLLLAERLMSNLPSESNASSPPVGRFPNELRTGLGYDVHAFAAPEAGRKLFLGGVEIPHDRGLEGHSDADVLLHAICDALLGAASLGDIGILFPNTDAAYKDIASLRLLAVVGERLRGAGWQIMNLDATVLAEAPKLMPHRAAMQEAIASCLHLDPARVSLKATTSEKMGFVGRQEGIACWAVATIRAV